VNFDQEDRLVGFFLPSLGAGLVIAAALAFLAWNSSDASVATVSSAGLVVAVAPGNADVLRLSFGLRSLRSRTSPPGVARTHPARGWRGGQAFRLTSLGRTSSRASR
jgi:hypothetical protein